MNEKEMESMLLLWNYLSRNINSESDLWQAVKNEYFVNDMKRLLAGAEKIEKEQRKEKIKIVA